jgi:ATP/maltotriose-dependent transcriptional regulator MalT
MSEAYNKNKNYKKALFFYKKFKILNDSIFNTEKTDLIAEKATKYETSEKDRTILEQKNEIQEQELDLQKKERRLLFTLIGFLVLTIILVVIYVNKLRRRIKHKDLVREFELGLNSYLKNKYVLNDDELNLWKKIFKGLSEKEQADVLFRSVNTIKTWRKSLYSKLKEVNPLNGNYSQKRAIVLYRDEEKLFERLSSE